MYFLGPESFDGISDTDLLAWLESVEAAYGEEASISLAQLLGLTERLEAAGLNPEYVANIRDHVSRGYARVQAKEMIQEIGKFVGFAADDLVWGKLEPVLEAPHMEPDLVWAISRAFWHEVVHRGMELGKGDAMWIKGIGEFPYDEVLTFAQHIWKAFKVVTGLDFTVPAESASIKFWLSLSPKFTDREGSPDINRLTDEDKRERLQHYIDHGGPSRKLMEEQGVDLDTVGQSHWQEDDPYARPP